MTFGRFKFLSRQPFPGLPIIDSYILQELGPPFLFGVGTFASVGLSVGALSDLVEQFTESGVPLLIALQIFLLQIPYFVSLALPMAVLLSTMMAYSRLSGDSEIVALRGCGVSLYRLALPAVAFSLLVSGLTFTFDQVLVPATKYQAAAILTQALNQEQPQLQNRDIFYQEFGPDDQLKRLFYAQQFDGQRMNGLTILDFSQKPLSQVVTAESAVRDPAQNTWNFFNGTIYLVAPDGSSRNILRFEKHQLQLPRTPLDLVSANPSSLEMNITQVSQRLQQARQQGDAKEVRKLEMRIQQKYSLPLMAVVFGVVGASLGVRPRRTSNATGFGISILIIFAHYLLSFVTDALGQGGFLSPVTAAWFPTVLGFIVGGWLLVSKAR